MLPIKNVNFFQRFLQKHNYDVPNKFGDADFKYVARFIAGGMFLHTQLYTYFTYLRVKWFSHVLNRNRETNLTNLEFQGRIHVKA